MEERLAGGEEREVRLGLRGFGRPNQRGIHVEDGEGWSCQVAKLHTHPHFPQRCSRCQSGVDRFCVRLEVGTTLLRLCPSEEALPRDALVELLFRKDLLKSVSSLSLLGTGFERLFSYYKHCAPTKGVVLVLGSKVVGVADMV